MKRSISISEVFGPTIQGEGAHIGKPTIFVRTGGCDYRCSWCDTLYAVLPEYRKDWTSMSPEAIFARIQELSPDPILVTLSGGNPAMQPLGPLIEMGRTSGYSFTIETQGSIFPDWASRLDSITLSPKPPSSGMKTNWKKLDRWITQGQPPTSLKIVIFDEQDYHFAREVHDRYLLVPMYLQPGNPAPLAHEPFNSAVVLEKMEWLIERAQQDRWNSVTILPQLHALLWGNTRGV